MIFVATQSRELATETRLTSEAFRALAEPLTPTQLAWTRSAGAWSVGQVLEHLLIVNGSYLQLCESLVARETPTRGAPTRDTRDGATWKPTLLGGLLARSVAPQSTRKLPAPKAFKPGPTARAEALAAFVAMQERLATLMERSATLDWNRLKGPSPITSLLRLNLGDAYQVLVNHSNRHLGQARRVVALPEFPRARDA